MGPRGLCRPLDESFQQTTCSSHPVRVARSVNTQGSRVQARAGQSPAGQGRAAGRAGRAGQGKGWRVQGARRRAQGRGSGGRAGRRAGTKEGGGQGVGQGRAGQRADREALIVLLRRSAGGLGRSFERPCKWSAEPSAV